MTKLTSKEVKTFLKEQGYNTKGIGVSVKHLGYSDTYITVTLKTIETAKKMDEIDTILHQQYENVSHCNITHEILQGCNTFVIVNLDTDKIEQESESYIEQAKKMYNLIMFAELDETYRVTLNEEKGIDLLKANFLNSGLAIVQKNTSLRVVKDIYSVKDLATALALYA